MRTFQLTTLGKRAARATNNADTENWRVIHSLDFLGGGTPDQIADQTGLSVNQVGTSLLILKRKRIVQEL